MMIRAALLMGIKVACTALNAHHAKVLRTLLVDWVVAQIKTGNPALTPGDKEARLMEAKPPRLVAWELQKRPHKRPGVQQDAAEHKRMKAAASLESMMATMHTPKKASPVPTASTEATTASSGTSSTPASVTPTATPSPKVTGPAAAPPNESLTALLKDWA